MDRRIIRICSGYTLNNFIKLNSSLFDRPRFSRCPRILKERVTLLNMIWKIENVVILKEEDGDNLGFHNFRISEFGILKFTEF